MTSSFEESFKPLKKLGEGDFGGFTFAAENRNDRTVCVVKQIQFMSGFKDLILQGIKKYDRIDSRHIVRYRQPIMAPDSKLYFSENIDLFVVQHSILLIWNIASAVLDQRSLINCFLIIKIDHYTKLHSI